MHGRIAGLCWTRSDVRLKQLLPVTGRLLSAGPPGAWFVRGNALANKSRFAEAIDAYDRVIAVRPDSAQTWFARGNTLGDLERHAEAIDSYDKAVTLRLGLC